MSKSINVIKNDKMYLLGGIIGALALIPAYFIWASLVYSAFTQYAENLIGTERLLSMFALIGIYATIGSFIYGILSVISKIYHKPI